MVQQGKHKIRRIFEGQIILLPSEEQILDDFINYLSLNKARLDEMWERKRILRFLYANNFKFDKTMKSMIEYMAWKEEKLPPVLTNSVQNFLNSGIIYTHGRDHRFRPIIVFNASLIDIKIVSLIDF